ncbi:MAG: APC family permease [Candidatus Eremiobacterota bacterium]
MPSERRKDATRSVLDLLDDSSIEFAGYGSARQITDLGSEPVEVTHLDSGLARKLGTWKATAICGNDITSSCLYVSALAALQAGPLAPLVLLLVAGVLYIYRFIYHEVVSALPLNGGAYNVLLNTTSKARASMAACLTLLSYVATAVISASEAIHYAANLVPGQHAHDLILAATVVLLGVFAFLNIMGMSESAMVALGIFVFHMATLSILAAAGLVLVMADPSLLKLNLAMPPADGIARALFLGFAAAMLGISGFESSANFVEEQKPGVFPKTLRNMWLAVAVFNPLLSLLSLGIFRVDQFQDHQNDLLADMGMQAAGPWLSHLVSLDAFLVLAGAVLTSYVGVTGLMRRMALDRCLPQVLLVENSWRRTNHWIILTFFFLCTSILLITRGDVTDLAGVYTIAFLGVMSLFAVGNLLLKAYRGRLPREVRVGGFTVVLGLTAVLVGLAGNIVGNPDAVRVFAVYFAVTGAVVLLMFLRIEILKVMLLLLRTVLERMLVIRQGVMDSIRRINDQPMIYFTKDDDLERLNDAAEYVIKNEQTRHLIYIHVYQDDKAIPRMLGQNLNTIDRIHSELRIDFVAVKGEFGPELIEKLSRKLGVPKNYMFISTPSDRFTHRLSNLGGVRLIL